MKNVRLRLLVASALTLFVAACSQVPTPQAQSETLTPQFGTKESEYSTQVAVSTSLKAIFIAGDTYGSLDQANNSGGTDGYLRRYKSDGSLVWGVQFGSSGYESETVKDLALDNQNGVYIAGFTQGGDAYGLSGFLRQYSADGKLIWSKKVSTQAGGDTLVYNIATDTRGGVFALGSTGNGEFSYINKYSRRGSLLWSKVVNTYYVYDAQTDQNGNLYTVTNEFVRKYDGSGRLMWTKDVSSATNFTPQALAVTENSLYVTGFKTWIIGNNDSRETDAYIGKLDLTGSIKWEKSFGTKVADEASAVASDSSGNIYVTGFTLGALGSKNVGGKDVIVRKFKPSSSVVWTRQFGSPNEDSGLATATLTPGELYIGGLTSGNLGAGNRGKDDAFLTRLDGDGKRIWTR